MLGFLLMLGFLDSEQFAKFGGCGSLTLAKRFGVRLEQAEQLVRIMSVILEDARPSLRHYSADQWYKLLQLRLTACHYQHVLAERGPGAGGKLSADPFGIAHRAAHG
jgi:hypothetical protein